MASVVLRQVIGGILRESRHARGLTLRDVSARASLSLGYLSEIERGQKEASSEMLWAVCTALDMPLSQVMAMAARRSAQQEASTVATPAA